MKWVKVIFDGLFIALFIAAFTAFCAIVAYHEGYKHGLDVKVKIVGEQYVMKVRGK